MFSGIYSRIFCLFGFSVFLLASTAHCRYFFNLDFEDLSPGPFTNPYELGRKQGSGSPNFIDATVKRAGKHSLKFVVNSGRNEYTHRNGEKCKSFTDYWYGYSIYIEKWPSGWAIVGQMHGTPDRSNAECKKACGSAGEAWRQPPLSWNMSADGKHYTLKAAWTSGKCNCSHGPGRDSKIDLEKLYILDIVHKKWYDIVHHVFWDHTEGGKGRVEVWLKEAEKTKYEKIADRSGQIGYDDDVGTYFNFGAHTGKGKVLYYDNVRMWEGGGSGFGSEGFKKVDPDPSGSSSEGAKPTDALPRPRFEGTIAPAALNRHVARAVTITGKSVPVMRIRHSSPEIILLRDPALRFRQ